MAAMGVFLAAVFAAGGYTFAAAWLHTGSLKPGFGEVSYIYKTFRIPEIARDRHAGLQLCGRFLPHRVVVALARTIWAIRPAARRPPSSRPDAMDHDYGDVSGDPARAKQIERDIFFGGSSTGSRLRWFP